MTTTPAAVQTEPRELDIRDLPVPDGIDGGEALVRVEGCGICGADYERYVGEMDDSGLFEYPVVLDNITVEGTLGTRAWSFERAISIIESGRYDLGALHTHTLDLAEIERALRLQGGEIGEDAFHITVTPDDD
jgi:threonine dehydrogenase-like Zn-dependent dehydrogenase